MENSKTKIWSIDDFEIGSVVGTGQYGKVYLAREKVSKCVVAIKAISRGSTARTGTNDLIQSEIEIQSHLSHKNILSLYGYFWDDSSLYMILEYGFYGDLSRLLAHYQFFSEPKAAWYINRMAKAIEYLQKSNVIHRDIKTENILIGEGMEPKLCDFGWAVHIDKGTRLTMCGTPEYAPPEVMNGWGYDETADNWCLGILTYELCTGKTPFEGGTSESIRKRILSESVIYPDMMSSLCQDFIGRLLVVDPSKRSTIQEVLRHPWLQNTI